MLEPKIDIRRSLKRSHTGGGWLESRHPFSFAHHQDPMNTHFGHLLVSNDDRRDGTIRRDQAPAEPVHLYVPVGAVALEGKGVLDVRGH